VLSPCDIWATGIPGVNTQSATVTDLLHWNGVKWTLRTSPTVPASLDPPPTVTATSDRDVWIAGTAAVSDGNAQTLIAHWNGVMLSRAASPNPGAAGRRPAVRRLGRRPGRRLGGRTLQRLRHRLPHVAELPTGRALERARLAGIADPERRRRGPAVRRLRGRSGRRLGGRPVRQPGEDPHRALERRQVDDPAQGRPLGAVVRDRDLPPGAPVPVQHQCERLVDSSSGNVITVGYYSGLVGLGQQALVLRLP
jgi:hypothetical protein